MRKWIRRRKWPCGRQLNGSQQRWGWEHLIGSTRNSQWLKWYRCIYNEMNELLRLLLLLFAVRSLLPIAGAINTTANVDCSSNDVGDNWNKQSQLVEQTILQNATPNQQSNALLFFFLLFLLFSFFIFIFILIQLRKSLSHFLLLLPSCLDFSINGKIMRCFSTRISQLAVKRRKLSIQCLCITQIRTKWRCPIAHC